MNGERGWRYRIVGTVDLASPAVGIDFAKDSRGTESGMPSSQICKSGEANGRDQELHTRASGQVGDKIRAKLCG